MPTVQIPVQLTVKHLMAAVKQLSPIELHEFIRQFAAWQNQQSQQTSEEMALVQATQERLPVAQQRRLERLSAKSERGTLTPQELDEYRRLAQQAEQLNVMRVEALAELVQRRNQPTHVIMEEVGWENGRGGA